jgi:hypothetical protein
MIEKLKNKIILTPDGKYNATETPDNVEILIKINEMIDFLNALTVKPPVQE